MKTENIIHKNILSYYSDDNNNLDAIYSIYYPADVDINKEIEDASGEMEDQELENGSLDRILDYLQKEKGLKIDYETLRFEVYDCDYNKFEEC